MPGEASSMPTIAWLLLFAGIAAFVVVLGILVKLLLKSHANRIYKQRGGMGQGHTRTSQKSVLVRLDELPKQVVTRSLLAKLSISKLPAC